MPAAAGMPAELPRANLTQRSATEADCGIIFLMRTDWTARLLAILLLLAVCGVAPADCHGDCDSDQCGYGCTYAIVQSPCRVSFVLAGQAGVCHGTFFILDSTSADIFEPPRFAA